MVLFLSLNVLQRRLELTRAHRKRTIPTLPEKAAIASVKYFDPLRGYLLYPLNELSLGNSSRQRGNNVNVISNTANVHNFGTDVTANCGQISVHARPHV